MQLFKLNMKDNWEPSVGEVKLWEYRYVFVLLCPHLRWSYSSLIVGILYRYDMITKCFHLNEIMIINILCISLLVGICWELQPARAFYFHALAWIGVLVSCDIDHLSVTWKCDHEIRSVFQDDGLRNCSQSHSLGNLNMEGEFPAQMASNAENVSI